jgi:hypothetical protein
MPFGAYLVAALECRSFFLFLQLLLHLTEAGSAAVTPALRLFSSFY